MGVASSILSTAGAPDSGGGNSLEHMMELMAKNNDRIFYVHLNQVMLKNKNQGHQDHGKYIFVSYNYSTGPPTSFWGFVLSSKDVRLLNISSSLSKTTMPKITRNLLVNTIAESTFVKIFTNFLSFKASPKIHIQIRNPVIELVETIQKNDNRIESGEMASRIENLLPKIRMNSVPDVDNIKATHQAIHDVLTECDVILSELNSSKSLLMRTEIIPPNIINHNSRPLTAKTPIFVDVIDCRKMTRDTHELVTDTNSFTNRAMNFMSTILMNGEDDMHSFLMNNDYTTPKGFWHKSIQESRLYVKEGLLSYKMLFIIYSPEINVEMLNIAASLVVSLNAKKKKHAFSSPTHMICVTHGKRKKTHSQITIPVFYCDPDWRPSFAENTLNSQQREYFVNEVLNPGGGKKKGKK